MISLVTKSADVAKAASSKRVTAQHLKKAIAADDQFDFLTDIVSRVVDGPSDSAAAAAKRAKDDDDSDEDSHKAVKKAKGRRKKGE
jgi:Dr1-associated corepressor